MKFKELLPALALFATISLARTAVSQSSATASQPLQLSVFAGATGTFTDLRNGKNLDFTAGADLTSLRFLHFKPALEFRGSYPVKEGHVSSQKSFFLGPKVEFPLGRLHPYADFLAGRGEIDYLNGGFVFGDFLVTSSNSWVYSPGGGLDYSLTHNLALKADFQYQHWETPVVLSGTIHPKATTFAVVYIFDFNPRHHHKR